MVLFDCIISWLYTRRVFGTRCSDYDAECHCCIAWKEHDELFSLF